MSAKKIITVFGATGNQGGAVVETFLSDPKLKDEWAVRGITRDVTKDSSKKLAEKGVDVVSADLNDKASLVQAMKGSHAVYAVTNYWEKMDHELEIQQGKNIADAAKETDVKLLIWSSLYNVNKHSNGALSKVHHFDSKALVEEYIRELGIPATFFMPGFYMTNFPGRVFRATDPNSSKSWAVHLPVPETAVIPMYLPADTGKYIKAAVLHADAVRGRHVLGASAYMTGREVVDAFRAAFPDRAAAWVRLSDDAYRAALTGAGMPGFAAEELLQNMHLLGADYGYYFGEPLDFTHSLVEDHLTSWAEYLKTAPAFA